jgi:hypothetical protein
MEVVKVLSEGKRIAELENYEKGRTSKQHVFSHNNILNLLETTKFGNSET